MILVTSLCFLSGPELLFDTWMAEFLQSTERLLVSFPNTLPSDCPCNLLLQWNDCLGTKHFLSFMV